MKEIHLQDGRVTLISDVDYERVRPYKWHVTEANASGKPYVRTAMNGKTVYLHRFITDCPDIYKVDHEDNDGLNNQRYNLRISTHEQNNLNRSAWGLCPYKGVSRHGRRWRARITFHGETVCLGSFDTPEDAAYAYDKAAYELFGEFAWLNFRERFPKPEHDIPDLNIPF